MAKIIDKIVQSNTPPQGSTFLWDDGENLKIKRRGNWEDANSGYLKTTNQVLNDTQKITVMNNLGMRDYITKIIEESINEALEGEY